MRKTLLTSVATIALIAGTGLASAQGVQDRGGNAPAAAQGGADIKGGADVKGNADIKAAPKAGAAIDEKAKPKQAQTPTQDMKGDRNRSRNTAEQNGRDKDGKTASDAKSDGKMDSKSQSTNSETKSSTTGQGAAGSRGGANLNSEQRTRITTVIRQSNAKPVTNVNFSISVGTRVPRSVHFYPLPVEVVSVYPDWRGYEFILVGDQIVVINPRTLEIVAVLEA